MNSNKHREFAAIQADHPEVPHYRVVESSVFRVVRFDKNGSSVVGVGDNRYQASLIAAGMASRYNGLASASGGGGSEMFENHTPYSATTERLKQMVRMKEYATRSISSTPEDQESDVEELAG